MDTTYLGYQVQRKSVGAIISNNVGQVLIVKRKDNEDFMPSVWEIPGGGVDPGGETLQRAIEREVREETGLSLSAAGVVNTCTYGDTVQFNYHLPLDLPLDVVNPTITLTEHSEYAWVHVDDLGKYFPPGDMILKVLIDYKVESARLGTGVYKTFCKAYGVPMPHHWIDKRGEEVEDNFLQKYL